MDYDNEPHNPPRQVTEWMALADKYKRERDVALERVRELDRSCSSSRRRFRYGREEVMDEFSENEWRKRPIVIKARRMRERFVTQTMEGELVGKPGDWLITGVRGEQYPCDDGVFRQTYEPSDTLDREVLPEGWEWSKDTPGLAKGDADEYGHPSSFAYTGGEDGRAFFIKGSDEAPIPVVLAVLHRAGILPTPALSPEQARDLLEWAAEMRCEMEADDEDGFSPEECSKHHFGRCWPCAAKVILRTLGEPGKEGK